MKRKLTYRQRLFLRRGEFLQSRAGSTVLADEARRRNWAANVQGLYTTYMGELKNPAYNQLAPGGYDAYKKKIESIMAQQKEHLNREGFYHDPTKMPLY